MPTPTWTPLSSLKKSFSKFARSIRLTIFSNYSARPRKDKTYYANPDWNPPRDSTSQATEDFLANLWKKIEGSYFVNSRPKVRRNLTSNQQSALSTLAQDKSLTVSGTDKNLGIAIHLTSFYESHADGHLSKYKRLTPAEAHTLIRDFRIALKKLLRNFLEPTDNLYKFLTKTITCASNVFPVFFLLWKIHKPTLVSRPITPCRNYITTPASKWIDQLLQPVVKCLSTVTLDSISIIRIIETTKFPDSAVLASKDVTNLYPSIPIREGVKRVTDLLYEFPKLVDVTLIPTIFDVLLLILLNAVVTFKDQFFLQLVGTAMGTPAAVVFAILFMYSLERDLVKEFQDQGLLLLYKRFIDDILSIFTTLAAAERFWKKFNKLHPNIKVTGVIVPNKAIFLDCIFLKGNRFATSNLLDVELYQKPLNNYLYLPFSSYHTNAQKVSFISNELKRYVVHFSQELLFLCVRQLFFHRLRARGYPKGFLAKPFAQVFYSQRQKFLYPSEAPNASEAEAPIFAIPWDPRTEAMNLPKIFHEEWLNVQDVPQLLPVPVPLTCYKRAPNLKNLVNKLSKGIPPY